MSNSTPAGMKIEYDNAAGTLVDITQHVLTFNGLSVEQLLEEKHSFGDSWEESLPIGIGKLADITLGGLFDDTATTGPDALFGGRIPETPATAGLLRTLKITWIASGKNTSVETILMKYDRKPDRNNLTKYEVTLRPTAATTEA